MLKRTSITGLLKKYGISRVEKEFHACLESYVGDIVEQTIKTLSVKYPGKLITVGMLCECMVEHDGGITEMLEEDLDEILLELRGEDDGV